MPKLKTHTGAKKRFKLTKNGKVKRAHAYKDVYKRQMLYVVNAYRYLTRTSGEAAQILGEIECAARLTATAVVNNSNLAEITTAEDISRCLLYTSWI